MADSLDNRGQVVIQGHAEPVRTLNSGRAGEKGPAVELGGWVVRVTLTATQASEPPRVRGTPRGRPPEVLAPVTDEEDTLTLTLSREDGLRVLGVLVALLDVSREPDRAAMLAVASQLQHQLRRGTGGTQ